jgi:NAD(P)-dependent dehydrogenase (short-subunit alcohol dehydrogenase family)
VIAITGAASGIGLTVANLAAQHGAKLALADLNSDELAKVVESLRLAGTDAIGTVVNVASSQDVDKWVGSIIEHFGRLDGAANMAGVEGKMSNTSALSDENWNSVISVNLTGLMYCIRAQVRVMKDKGSIVNAASIAGLRGGSGMSAYSASKHGVIGLTKSVAKEEGVRGIRVNAVAP